MVEMYEKFREVRKQVQNEKMYGMLLTLTVTFQDFDMFGYSPDEHYKMALQDE